MSTQLMNENLGLPLQVKVRIEVLLDFPANQSRVKDCKCKCLHGPSRKCEDAKRAGYNEKTKTVEGGSLS